MRSRIQVSIITDFCKLRGDSIQSYSGTGSENEIGDHLLSDNFELVNICKLFFVHASKII